MLVMIYSFSKNILRLSVFETHFKILLGIVLYALESCENLFVS